MLKQNAYEEISLLRVTVKAWSSCRNLTWPHCWGFWWLVLWNSPARLAHTESPAVSITAHRFPTSALVPRKVSVLVLVVIIFVLACQFLWFRGQQFALWPHVSYGSKKFWLSVYSTFSCWMGDKFKTPNFLYRKLELIADSSTSPLFKPFSMKCCISSYQDWIYFQVPRLAFGHKTDFFTVMCERNSTKALLK